MGQKLHFGDEATLLAEMDKGSQFGQLDLNALKIVPSEKPPQHGVEVRLAAIVARSPAQTRRPFDPEKSEADRALVDSLAALGQIENVCLAEVGTGQYQIVWGHRRVDALRYLGRETVRALFMAGDQLALSTATAVENSGQSLSPIEQAEQARFFAEALGLTRAQIAARLGCSERYVKQLKELLRADDAVRFALAEGRFSANAARALGRAPREHQPRLAEIAAAHRLTESEAGKLVEHMQATAATPDEAAAVFGLAIKLPQQEAHKATDTSTAEDDLNDLDQAASPEAIRPRSENGAAPPHARKRGAEPLTVESATLLLTACLPRLNAQTARKLAAEAARKGVTAGCLRVAGLLAASGKGVTAKALDTAVAIEGEAVVKLALEALIAQERLRDLMRRDRAIPATGLLLRALVRQFEDLQHMAEVAAAKSRKPGTA